MAKLPLSVNDYEKSVLLAALITKVNDGIIALPSVTDAVFKPVINGYEVTFKLKGDLVKLEFKTNKSIFSASRLTLRIFAGSRLIKTFKTDNADEAFNEIESILTQTKDESV